MHPQVLQAHNGLCSICGMQLTPQEERNESASAAVVVDPVIVQNIGIRTAEVIHGRLRRIVRGFGTLTPRADARFEIASPEDGIVARLTAVEDGTFVHRGDVLLEIQGGSPGNKHLARTDTAASRSLSLSSPVDGYVTTLAVIPGQHVRRGQPLLRILNPTSLSIEASTSQDQLPFLRPGQQAEVRFPALPGEKHKAKLVHAAPDLDPAGRKALIRVELDTPSPKLRPGMQGHIVVFAMSEEETLLAPREAVIDTGTRRIAFVQVGNGIFEPRELRIGASADDWVQVREGLDKGARVVTSGQFLLDGESRVQQAIEKYRAGWVPPVSKPESSTH